MAAGALIILIAVCAAMIVANVCFKRSRPIEPRNDVADGDFPAIPSELKVFHIGTDSTRRRNDHVRR